MTNYTDRLSEIRPQDDFFGYVNDKWLKANPIPDSETRWGEFNVLRDEAWHNLKNIFEGLDQENPKQNSIEQQARDFYYTGMNFNALEAPHMARVNKYLRKIDEIKGKDDLWELCAELELIGVSTFWSLSIDADDKDSSRHILHLRQPHLTLPDRDYYLEDNARMKHIRQEYADHAERVHQRFPILAENKEVLWETLWSMELGFATNSRSSIALRDVEKNYNQRSFESLSQDYSNVVWVDYASALGWQTTGALSVDQPEYFEFLNQQLAMRHIDDLKLYLKWRFIVTFYGLISDEMAELKFEFFGKVLSGAKELMPLWKRAVLRADDAIGEGVGRLYAEKHFPEASKKQVLGLVEDIRKAYGERIEQLDWMSAETKKKALRKLANIKVLIGYPDKWRDYSKLKIGRESYIDNIMAAERFDTAYYLGKLLQPTSRDDWFMNPQTVNAYHDPNRLVICFPAAILQKPFFDPAEHIAANLGGIGAVIGHEFTHGFDDQGCLFDENGNVKTWQTDDERKAFMKRAQVIIDQANDFEVLPGVHLKGELVIGESIADLGGIEISYHALKAKIPDTKQIAVDNLTADQLFFINFATSECGHTRDERARELAISDPHPAESFRVNGMLAHVNDFYRVFDVKSSDKIFLAPSDRAKIW